MTLIKRLLNRLQYAYDWFFPDIGDGSIDWTEAAKLDPKHITVEAVAKTYKASEAGARLLLERGVSHGSFRKENDYYVLNYPE